MNPQERSELDALKRRQAELQQELNFLSSKLTSLEQRLAEPKPPRPAPISPPPFIPLPKQQERPPAPVGVAPPIESHAQNIGTAPVSTSLPPAQPSKADPLKPKLQREAAVGGTPLQTAAAVANQPEQSAGGTAPPITPPPLFQKPPPAKPKDPSFEMRLGTYWLVRVGIVMLLTGLVFFGNYAYQNFISKFGAAGKISLLYLASVALLGAGWWWQRKAVKETLRNYGQVLFAGGLAAFYFTTYAAHHFEHLRVIQSATLDGLLLLLWAAFIVWIADRRKSEVLALFAILLAYYTAIISHEVGLFTLYSNLLLTIAAVYFMVRNRWAALSFASLGATYASYTFWRFLHGGEWHWAYPEEGLWTGTYFLISYWVVFTAAVFLSREANFSKENRSSFLTLNNGAFFALFLLTMLQVNQGGFWKFALCYGAALLVLALLAKILLPAEPLTRNAYLTQGLLLATAGIISHPRLAGLNLAIVLAVESITLLMAGQMRKNLVLLAGAYISAALAIGWGMDGMLEHEPHGMWLGMGLGALMLANTMLAHRAAVISASGIQHPESRIEHPASSIPSLESRLRLRVGYFALLALGVWFVATYNNTSGESFPIVLAAEGLLLTVSIYLLGVPELTVFAQLYLVIAQAVWLAKFALPLAPALPWYNPFLLVAITLMASHWWQKQNRLRLEPQSRWFVQGVYALAIVGVLYLWIGNRVGGDGWLAISAFLAVALTAYGAATRAWMLAACGQLFVVVAAIEYVKDFLESDPKWFIPLAPVFVLLVLSTAAATWFRRKPGTAPGLRGPLLQLAQVYRIVALAMSIWWVAKYIPERERVWVYALLGLLVFGYAGWKRDRESLLFGAAFTACGLVQFWISPQKEPGFYFPTLLGITSVLIEQRIAKRLPERFALPNQAHAGAIIVGALSVWLFVSRWVLAAEPQQHAYLTASWSAVALIFFGCGILTRERVYRWTGLGILACAVGRVVLVDVWRLEVIYRVLSFMAIGIVLLVLGFIYSKYQEKIREWL